MNLDNITLAAKHVPDPGGGPFDTIQQAIAAGHDTLNPITGTVQIGIVVDGAFVPFYSEKASLVNARIKQAKANAEQSEQDAPASQVGATGSASQGGEQPQGQPEQPQGGAMGSGYAGGEHMPPQPPEQPSGEPQG